MVMNMVESIFSVASATLVGLGLKSRKTDRKKSVAGLGNGVLGRQMLTAPTLGSAGAHQRHDK